MKRKIAVPINLISELEVFGIIPNANRLEEAQLFELWQAVREKADSSVKNWTDAVMKKMNIDPSKYAAIIDVLAFPYGGHRNGKDCAGEYFHPGTDFLESYLPYPPIVYCHGYDVDGKGEATRTVIGETLQRWKDESGGWVRIGIIPNTTYTEEIIDAHKQGYLMSSSTALLRHVDPDEQGKIDTWLAGEISLITPQSGMEPCNFLAGSKGGQKSQSEIMQLIEEQPEEYRKKLQELLDKNSEMMEDAVVVADNYNPTNPENEPDDDSEEVSLNEEEEEMTKEEIQAIVNDAVSSSLASAVKTLKEELSAVPATPPPDDEGRQKGDMQSFLAAKTAAAKATGSANKQATELVDAWITEGRINPELRLDTVAALSAAIQADERMKSGTKNTESFIKIIESNLGFNASGEIRGYGFQPSKVKEEAAETEVENIIKAALA